MHIRIFAGRLEITDAIRDYIERRLLPLEYSHPEMLSADVMLDLDEKDNGRRFLVKTRVRLKEREVNRTYRCAHLHEGIDIAAQKLACRLRHLPGNLN